MLREQGSDTRRVEIRGGTHDGATGRIVRTWDEGESQIVTVALDSGGIVELTLPSSREKASAETIRTLGT